MGFELREHTADVAVEATGETLGETFGAVADGMAAAMTTEWPPGGESHDIAVEAEEREALLFDYLDELIYERDVRGVLPVDNTGTVEGGGGHAGANGTDTGSEGAGATGTDRGEDNNSDAWRFEGQYRGIPLEEVTARDLKAVTYSDMEIRETAQGWFAYVVFDV